MSRGTNTQRVFTLFTFVLVVFTLVVLAPAANALEFLTPAEGATFSENATVMFSWDEFPITFSITGSSAQTINATNTTRILAPGNYTASITNSSNATVNRTIAVNSSAPIPLPPQSNQSITLSTEEALYEAGASARIRVTVTEPEQLTLTVTRPSGGTDQYTIAVTTQTDFLYATSATGLYTISVLGQTSGAVAASSFTVQNTSITVQITGATSGTAGRVTSFGSAVQGGTAPLQYLWQFSDNTTSTGASADHVFPGPGLYTVTLVVTDSVSRTASSNRTVTIIEETYRLTVNVLGDNGRLLRNATVVLVPSVGGASRTEITDDLGRVRFNNLTPAQYAMNMTYAATELTPLITYADNRTVTITDDTVVTIQFDVPDPAEITNGTNITNSSNVTPVSNSTTNMTGSSGSLGSGLMGEIPITAALTAEEQSLQTMQAEYEQSIAAARANAQNDIRDREGAIARSEARAEIARVLRLEERFAQANKAIQSAQTEEGVRRALDDAPRDITILSRDSTIQQRTVQEAEHDIEAYLIAIQADKEMEKQVRYTLRSTLKDFTIATRRSVVRITDGRGMSETFTIIEREAPQEPGMTYVEIIPKEFASTVTDLTISGSHEVVDPDPIIKFLTHDYSYFVQGTPEAETTVLPLPQVLLEKPGLLGFAAVKLNMDSMERGKIYLAVLLFIIIGVVGSNLVLRARATSRVEAFTQLAQLALDAAESANPASVSSYVKELEGIARDLSSEEQKSVAETLAVLKSAAASGEFRSALEHCRTTLTLNDVVAMAGAYERVLAAHAALPDDAQKRTQAAVDGVHRAIEEHLTLHEAETKEDVYA